MVGQISLSIKEVYHDLQLDVVPVPTSIKRLSP